MDDAHVESGDMATSRHQAPRLGELGIFTLRQVEGDRGEPIRMHCRVANVTPAGVGLTLISSELTRGEREALEKILTAG